MISICVLSQDFAYQYNVKFVCGASQGQVVGPGVYHTAINILNANSDSVVIQSVISVALPRTPGVVSGPKKFTLGLNNSFEIDCPEIMERTRSQFNFRKGFVIISSTQRLEVVAVYTASGDDRKVESIFTERVPHQKVLRPCPDLVVDSIGRPYLNNRQSIITVKIKNVGTAGTLISTETMLTDPSTIDPTTGERYKRVLATPPLGSGDHALLTFSLPYNVYNPDAFIRVDGDYVNALEECVEDNNSKEFHSP